MKPEEAKAKAAFTYNAKAGIASAEANVVYAVATKSREA
jgi:hypothetical protein